MSRIIDGTELAARFRARTKERALHLVEKTGMPPGLGVILIGEDPASQAYVRSKEKAATEAGFYSRSILHDANVTTADVVGMVEELNRDSRIHGILVQLPLPKQVDETQVLHAVASEKDADGFHPASLGKLVGGNPDGTFAAPCTPWGIIKALQELGVSIEGKHAVVVGRSVIVGKPMALLLTHANATVTICHSKTRDLASITRQADILVAAVGRPFLISKDHVKEGAVVIDVGMNRVEPAFLSAEAMEANPAYAKSIKARGYALVGDVAFHEVRHKASLITPVPGGVGPLTIAMLLENTLDLAYRQLGVSPK